MRRVGRFLLTLLFALICTLKHVHLNSWPLPRVPRPLPCALAGEGPAVSLLPSDTSYHHAWCEGYPWSDAWYPREPDPWSVPRCPQQGLAESCGETHHPCLGPPPSHGRGVVVLSHPVTWWWSSSLPYRGIVAAKEACVAAGGCWKSSWRKIHWAPPGGL